VPSTSLRPRGPETDSGQRPLAASFAAAFGALLTAEVLFLGCWLVVSDARLDRVTVVVGVLVVASAAGSVLVARGVRGGWVLLVLAAVGALAALLLMALIFGALGVASAMWAAALLAVGPLGCLVLAPRRSVREWSGPAPTRRSAGGRRAAARSR
jgi:hypothetical protein